MRRSGCAIAAFAVLALGACSRQDSSSVSQDAHDASASAKQAVTNIGQDADLKRAAADLRHMGHDAAVELRKDAGEARSAAHTLASDTHHAVKHAGENADHNRRDRDQAASG